MNIEITNDLVEIIPKTKYLSGSEMIILKNKDIGITSTGLKKTMPKNTEEEIKELEKLYDCLEQQLSRPHIERLAGRTLAEWDNEAKAVLVIHKDGKFEHFGVNKDGKHYLEYYEALFLLEMNRLHLKYNSCVMSIEQAYLLLMGEMHCYRYHEYLVYSVMTRVGYILKKYENRHDIHPHRKQTIQTPEDCVWHILEMEMQQQKKPQKQQTVPNVPDNIRKPAVYTKIKEQFQQIKEIIKTQGKNKQNAVSGTGNEETLDFRKKMQKSLKRPAQSDNDLNCWHNIKRICTFGTKTANTSNKSLIDFLKSDTECEKFRETFHKLNIVPSKSYDSENEEAESETAVEILPINFDVYLRNEGFRKSSPQFRIVILKPKQPFPTHQQICFTHRQQLNPTTVLLITVNESKQLQAFLYYFS
uniref:tRNA_int_end_N2 domain-containing protein n=1 Tax=Glossina brevipalpis TaxID=37001 RepID=A0A1A9W545_9MUSC